MGDGTGISWTDATWNPVRGCSRVSPGCMNCYAERVAARFSGPGQPYEGLARHTTFSGPPTRAGRPRWTGEVRLIPEHLADPLRWKKPRRIFVNSMSDLFHEGLANEQIDQVFAVMLLSPRHTFQVLTKRARRMREYMTDPGLYDRVLRAAGVFRDERPELNQIAIDNPTTCPKSWIWLGVSVEDQAAADERIPELLRTPAAIRFLSCEPLLGPLSITRYLKRDILGTASVDWVIVGCESGPKARDCHPDWIRSLVVQCNGAGVPAFVKQAVAWDAGRDSVVPYGIGFGPGSKRKGSGYGGPVIELPYLDGVQHAAFPEVQP